MDDGPRGAQHEGPRLPRERLLRGVAVPGGGRRAGEVAARVVAARDARLVAEGAAAERGAIHRRGVHAAGEAEGRAVPERRDHPVDPAGGAQSATAAVRSVPQWARHRTGRLHSQAAAWSIRRLTEDTFDDPADGAVRALSVLRREVYG